ncbi:MAG: hypothetical protein J6C84_07255 [Lachnospiraceae bacterium]|nr:hypothetical protein [Lachnospiraceae bacterium]
MKNKAQTAFFSTLVLCVVILVVIYMYVFQPYAEKTQMLVNSNMQLASRVAELEAFYAQMPQYKEQMTAMQTEIQDTLAAFPADVKEEDAIYLALRSWEEGILVGYRSISIGEREELARVGADIVQGSGMEEFPGQDLVFNKRLVTYSNITTYQNLKDLITCINDNQEEVAITNVAYALNDEDMLLEGTIDVTFYMVDGTGKEYIPREFKDYETGLSNLFASSEEME